MSTISLYSDFIINSGAIQAGVPAIPVVLSLSDVSCRA